MKRSALLITVLVLFTIFVNSQAINPDNEETYNNVQENIDKIPIDDEGIDEEKLSDSYQFFSSKTEERINEINNWIEENAAWLNLFFRMIPEISWLFAWNVFFILFFFTHLILNAKKIWFFIENDLLAIGFGSCIFLILLFVNFYLFISEILVNIFDVFFNTVLPWGIFIAAILIIILFLVFILLIIFAPQLIVLSGRVIMKLLGRKVADSQINKLENKLNDIAQKNKEQSEKQESFLQGAGLS